MVRLGVRKWDLLKKILKMGVASKMADDYGVFPAVMYLANSKPDADDEICEIPLTEDASQFEIEKDKLCNYLYDNIKIVLKFL